MSRHKEAEIRLREELAKVFPSKERALQIARDSDIDVARIPLSDTPIELWDVIVREAMLRDKIDRLFDRVTHEYSSYPQLNIVMDEFRQLGIPRSTSPLSDSPKTPQPNIPIGRLQPSVDHINNWFRQHGFWEDPFTRTEAGREVGRLQGYFVETPVFEENLTINQDLRSTVIAAGAGCGKTAHRMMVAQTCQPHNPTSSILAVEYTTFSQFGDRFRRGLPLPGVREHVASLLNISTEVLLRSLMNDPSLADRMPYYYLGRLKWFWITYGSSANQPSIFYSRIMNHFVSTDEDREHVAEWTRFANGWRKSRLTPILKETSIWRYPQVRFLGYLVDACPEPLTTNRLHVDALFLQLLDLVHASGLTNMCLLVDHTDESHMLASNPERVSSLLVPLLAELSLMEMPGIAFKFFLPLDVTRILAASSDVRLDRIPFRELEWTTSLLNDLLEQRLAVYSNGQVTDIGQLCEEGDLGAVIQKNLIESARGIPRNLLRSARQLVIEHCILNPDRAFIQYADWQALQQAAEIRDFFIPEQVSVQLHTQGLIAQADSSHVTDRPTGT